MSSQSASQVELPPNSYMVTCTAPVNIAVIKYWGKRDSKLILPVNSSLSGTLHMDTMCSRTTIIVSKAFETDSMTLNGEEEDLARNKRMQKVIALARERAGDLVLDGAVRVRKGDWGDYRLRIISSNNFPTAAGLASSASGFACMAKCLSEVFAVTESFSTEHELSMIARQGSGSACRSLDGGFVKWNMGEREDGMDSNAEQVCDEEAWPEMRVLILVVNKAKKEVSSTSGMQSTVETSPLMKYRTEVVVPQRMADIERAILAKDYEAFADITMADSNQFHACCLDTLPPIFYLNDTSKRIIGMVHAINAAAGRAVCAYTFDAGPNAVIYLLEPNLQPVFNTFMHYFSPPQGITDPMDLIRAAMPDDEATRAYIAAIGDKSPVDLVSRVIVSRLGPGAKAVYKKATFGATDRVTARL